MAVLRKLPTPDAPLTTEFKQVLLTIPKNADLDRFLWGAVSHLAFWSSWDKVGTMEQEDAARYFKDILASRKDFEMLGTIFPVFRETLPDYMLLCDGSVYNRIDYPQLWEVLPSGSKDANTFTVPDLRERFPLGASVNYPVSSVGGLSEVTLTVAEMPSHTHGYSLPTFNVDVESVGVPDPTGVGQPALPETTTSAGSDQPHENMPPYLALQYAMIAKVSS